MVEEEGIINNTKSEKNNISPILDLLHLLKLVNNRCSF